MARLYNPTTKEISYVAPQNVSDFPGQISLPENVTAEDYLLTPAGKQALAGMSAPTRDVAVLSPTQAIQKTQQNTQQLQSITNPSPPSPDSSQNTYTEQVTASVDAVIKALSTANSGANSGLATELSSAESALKTARTNLHTIGQRNIDAIRESFVRRAQQMEELNKRQTATYESFGFSSGLAQFSPLQAAGLVTESERQGIQRLTDLDAERSAALSKAELALAEGDVNALNDHMKTVREQMDKMTTITASIAKEIVQENRKRDEDARKATRLVNIQKAVSTLIGKGFADSVSIYNALVGAGYDATFDEIDKVLDTLPKPAKPEAITGPAGEYHDAVAEGLVPKSILALPKDQQLLAWLKQKGEVTREPDKRKPPISPLDVQRYKEMGVTVPFNVTDEEAANIAAEQLKPRDYKDAELKAFATEAKSQNISFEKVVSNIDGNDRIKNKEQAKAVAAEVYGIGKKGGGLFSGISSHLRVRQSAPLPKPNVGGYQATSLEEQLRTFNQQFRR